ncbi:MAG TPA: c-type cytochrome [Gammaproteobacteria bacterium]|nr:c-type cytochrome [Gammaproteobacteria bacterium]
MKTRILSLLLLAFCASASAYDYDPDIGEEINEVCAGCHGEFGQGSEDGEYPRIAGQPAAYIERQLHLFQDRKRPNLPMVEHVEERQLPSEDIFHIAQYLSRIQLKTKLPPVDEQAPDFDAYARLLESKQLMQIPRAPGDVKKGRKLYRRECGSCHGREGWGRPKKGVPMLAGQYTDYLWRQVKKFRKGIRIHDEDDPEEELLNDFRDEELRDIFAYLSTVDD